MSADLFFFRAAGYLKYILSSSNRKGHGIHSPFVFDLVTRVFRDKTDKGKAALIEKLRKRLKEDNTIIEVTDLGAGSGGERNKTGKVSDIIRKSAVPIKYGMLLSNMAHEFGMPLIIEFGTSFGISTMYMASGCTSADVITMEGSSVVAEIASGNFIESGLAKIKVLIGSFEENLDKIVESGIRPGLVFIDGNHRKEATLDYFYKIAEISDRETVVIIDDINYSPGMAGAWSLIKEHEKVSVTIDLFRMGIVFFRKGAARQHYMIWY
jgi:predicted O-methyltransferase YrrM